MDDDTIEMLGVLRLKEFLRDEITAAHAHIQMANKFKQELIDAGCDDVEQLVNDIEDSLHVG